MKRLKIVPIKTVPSAILIKIAAMRNTRITKKQSIIYTVKSQKKKLNKLFMNDLGIKINTI